MNPGKRDLDRGREDEGKKLQRLLSGSSMLAALQKDVVRESESRLRPLVREEVERVVSRHAPCFRFPQQQLAASPLARRFHLRFISNPAAEAFTGKNLEGEHGGSIDVQLVDGATGQAVTKGPESAAELELVPLEAEFDIPDEQDWTPDIFKGYVAKEREGKGPLLAGQLKVFLAGGQGKLGCIYFTDNSHARRLRQFRLGVAVAEASDSCGLAASIREGKSKAFSVKDNRGIGNMKRETPSPRDEVWRLRHIQRNGPNHKKLEQHGIFLVQDFLHWSKTRPLELKNMFDPKSTRIYDDIVSHALKCNGYKASEVFPDGNSAGTDVISDTGMVQMDLVDDVTHGTLGIDLTEGTVGDGTAAGEPFTTMGYQMHVRPSPTDRVSRLPYIPEDGLYHTRLMEHGVQTIQDFLRWVDRRPEDVQKVFGKMHVAAWEEILHYAQRIAVGDKLYVYPVNESPLEGVVFAHDYQTLGAITQDQYIPLDAVDDARKVDIDGFVKNAYDGWPTNITECTVGDPARAIEAPFNNIASASGPAYISATTDFVEEPIPSVQAPEEEQHNLELLREYLLGGDGHNILSSSVHEVLREYVPFECPRDGAPVPTTNRWWLRIRAVVRCALFIRNLGINPQHNVNLNPLPDEDENQHL